jgi:catechol 2,3-dioxygenase-like lactoylglutathione lyase family enzyme
MRIDRLDHLVLTVTDLAATIAFYRDVLGMEVVTFGAGRTALTFGDSKINLHEAGNEFEPKAQVARPGTADLCFIVDEPVADVMRSLQRHGVALVDGPVERTGARGPILSCYVRDPDGNLIELSNYL